MLLGRRCLAAGSVQREVAQRCLGQGWGGGKDLLLSERWPGPVRGYPGRRAAPRGVATALGGKGGPTVRPEEVAGAGFP